MQRSMVLEDLKKKMEKTVKITIKNVAISPYRGRLVANLVRGMSVERALDVLTFLNKKAAKHVKKALDSGIASAKEIIGKDEKSLKIVSLTIDQGINRRGFIFESKGRVSRLTKRRSHKKPYS